MPTRPTTGNELWKSDGTKAGTKLVRDLEPRPGQLAGDSTAHRAAPGSTSAPVQRPRAGSSSRPTARSTAPSSCATSTRASRHADAAQLAVAWRAGCGLPGHRPARARAVEERRHDGRDQAGCKDIWNGSAGSRSLADDQRWPQRPVLQRLRPGHRRRALDRATARRPGQSWSRTSGRARLNPSPTSLGVGRGRALLHRRTGLRRGSCGSPEEVGAYRVKDIRPGPSGARGPTSDQGRRPALLQGQRRHARRRAVDVEALERDGRRAATLRRRSAARYPIGPGPRTNAGLPLAVGPIGSVQRSQPCRTRLRQATPAALNLDDCCRSDDRSRP